MNKRRTAEGWVGEESPGRTGPPRYALAEIARRPYDAELNVLRKAMKEGNEGALFGAFALLLHGEHVLRKLAPPQLRAAGKIPVPIWIVRAAASGLLEHIITAPPSGRGRTPRWATRYREDMKHLARYEAVLWAMETHRPGEDRFEKARDCRLRMFPYVAPETIRSSYKKVKKSLESSEQRFRSLAYLKSEELFPGEAAGKK